MTESDTELTYEHWQQHNGVWEAKPVPGLKCKMGAFVAATEELIRDTDNQDALERLMRRDAYSQLGATLFDWVSRCGFPVIMSVPRIAFSSALNPNTQYVRAVVHIRVLNRDGSIPQQWTDQEPGPYAQDDEE